MNTEAIPAGNGRDPMTGAFRPGHQLSVGNKGGNPNVRRQSEYKRALIACGSEEDIQKLYKTLMTAALGGDVQAAKLLLDHLVGRPAQAVEISNADQHVDKGQGTKLTAIFLSIIGDDPEKRAQFAAALRGEAGQTLEVEANGSTD
jgi:hypothetical protein